MKTIPSPLMTDFYQLTMASGFFQLGMENHESVFHYFFRRPPFAGGFTITAGLENFIEFISAYRFGDEEIDFLKSLRAERGKNIFPDPFLDYLREMRLTLDIDAIPEGNVIFPFEPIIRVKGPLIQAQLLETTLLNLMNFPTLIATKAARVALAAKGDPVLEFGMRRAQGIDGAITASRAAYIGGVSATSNVMAGKIYGIPVRGTQAHSWILSFDDEMEAFRAYAESFGDHPVLLVDTFDTQEGVKKAIEIGKELKKRGKELFGIRLDSGDLAFLSEWAREELDKAGFNKTEIFASNELDEGLISELKRQGAKISYWGVGTQLVTGGSQSALDGVYKLSAIKKSDEWEYKLKLSEQMQKISNPGFLQLKRYFKGEKAVADLIYDEWMGLPPEPIFCDPIDTTRKKKLSNQLTSKTMLEPIFRNGKLVYSPPCLNEIRAKTEQSLSSFPTQVKRFVNPHLFPVGFEKNYHERKLSLIQGIRNKKIEIT